MPLAKLAVGVEPKTPYYSQRTKHYRVSHPTADFSDEFVLQHQKWGFYLLIFKEVQADIDLVVVLLLLFILRAVHLPPSADCALRITNHSPIIDRNLFAFAYNVESCLLENDPTVRRPQHLCLVIIDSPTLLFCSQIVVEYNFLTTFSPSHIIPEVNFPNKFAHLVWEKLNIDLFINRTDFQRDLCWTLALRGP